MESISSIILDLFIVIRNNCVKSVRIRSFSGRYFPEFGLNTFGYSVFGKIPCAGKYRPKILQIWTLFMQGCYAQQRSLKKDFSFSILMRKCDWFKMIPSENSNSNSFKFSKKNTNVSNGSYICKIDLLFI